MMKTHLLFALLAAAAIASPGPGVLMTLGNASRHGLRHAFCGIAGLAMGATVTATLSASGAGLLLASTPSAFAALRYAGALYLVYLGWRQWQRPAVPSPQGAPSGTAGALRSCWEGVGLQLTNPKSLLFFLSVLPQFTDPAGDPVGRLLGLVATYCLLLVLVHGAYALIARQGQAWFAEPGGRLLAARLSGSCFIFFGLMLACFPPQAVVATAAG